MGGRALTDLTLGVEEEFHLVDLQTRTLAPRAAEVLRELPARSYGAELQRSTVEANTEVAGDLEQLRGEIRELRTRLISVAGSRDLGVVSAGTVPLVGPGLDISDNQRFRTMRDDYTLLVDEQLICGLQVHVGLPDREVAVAVAARIGPWLPLLLALSASSPFWEGRDTGYASNRLLLWQRWPTAGTGPTVQTLAEYDDLVAALVRSGAISDPGMIYFDVRPSAHVPTLEMRVTDACPLIGDVVLIAGLFRAAVMRERDNAAAGRPAPFLPVPLQRAALWRAARSGLEGQLIDLGDPDGARELDAHLFVRTAVDRLRPQLEALGDWEHVSELMESSLSCGTSAARQRSAYYRSRKLTAVVDLLMAETGSESAPGPAPKRRTSMLADYRVGRFDEAMGPTGAPRSAHGEVLRALRRLGPEGLRARERVRDRLETERRMTFRVGEENRLYPVDLVPRVVPGDEWSALSSGLVQRARALEAFLEDVYDGAAVVRDGVVPAELVERAPGRRPSGHAVPQGATRAHVMGVDLVRDGTGVWRVLEDNLRVPSGLAYGLACREITDAVMPELPRPAALLPADGVPELLLETLLAAAPPGAGDRPGVAVLSGGPSDSAWFEHELLASRMDVPVLVAGDLLFSADGVARRTADGGSEPVHVLYFRHDEDQLAMAAAGDGRPVGDRLLTALRAGQVALANAPGNGLGDDKALYAYVPALIGYYLGEQPLLAQVPTYQLSDPEQLAAVLPRLGELVLKPVDGYGGSDVLMGSVASEEQLDAARRAVLRSPHHWIAQETVSLSTHPTFDGHGLVPQRVDLRLFALTGGPAGSDQVRVPTVGLTRVAPPGGLIVNSSRGGGAKDTWLLGPPVDAADLSQEAAVLAKDAVGLAQQASSVDVRGRAHVRAGG